MSDGTLSFGIVALIMAGAGAIAYIIGEGFTDAAAAEKSVEE